MPVCAIARSSICAFCAATALVACGPSTPIFAVDPAEETTGEGQSSSESTSTAAQGEPPSSSSSEGNNGNEESTDGLPTMFLAEPDGGGISFECDLWAQDC